ncbi:hypothetical protein [Acinetobacter radioresistens]|uniref:hypothetical protein n=1 Tax=Acinetobacter radioresistens TaxID=40216 RepID=UPI0021CDD7EB|nr:hypothetical protein [Acinetobacter radioresistens]MCU4568323.1 hypothetical protein [Acinetobacter radioresistens]
MVASTDIKFYVHSNNNAPQLQNAYGSMINVLDACLINGIQIGVLSSLTAAGKTVTALFSSAHNLMPYQVIKITGATQSEFNGEHRILTVPNSNEVTFELATVPSVAIATGTITASLPPLGWEKPFSSTSATGGKGAYRPKNTLSPNRPFLRVVDELDPVWTSTYAKYAKVGIVEDMTDIDTMMGMQAPFDLTNPNKNWIGAGSGEGTLNGWAVWAYALASNEDTSSNLFATPPSGAREWFILGSSDYVYVFPRFHTDVDTKNRLCPYFFGNIGSGFALLHSVISGNSISPWSAAVLTDLNYSSKSGGGSCLLNDVGVLKSIDVLTFTLFYTLYTSPPGRATSGNTELFKPQFGNKILSTNIIALDGASAPIGNFPSCEFLHAKLPYPHLQTFNEVNYMKIAVNCIAYEQGEVLFNLGEL